MNSNALNVAQISGNEMPGGNKSVIEEPQNATCIERSSSDMNANLTALSNEIDALDELIELQVSVKADCATVDIVIACV